MKYVRRLMGWFASRLLLLALLLSLCVIVFYYAMNVSNIHVVLKDGMAKRAQVIMGAEDVDAFRLYVTTDYQEADPVPRTVAEAARSVYQRYNVVGIDHRMAMDFVWFWPWDTSKTVIVTERIPKIDGRAKSSYAEALIAEGGAGATYPPAWQSARYQVTLRMVNRQWKISRLELIGTVGDEAEPQAKE